MIEAEVLVRILAYACNTATLMLRNEYFFKIYFYIERISYDYDESDADDDDLRREEGISFGDSGPFGDTGRSISLDPGALTGTGNLIGNLLPNTHGYKKGWVILIHLLGEVTKRSSTSASRCSNSSVEPGPTNRPSSTPSSPRLGSDR